MKISNQKWMIMPSKATNTIESSNCSILNSDKCLAWNSLFCRTGRKTFGTGHATSAARAPGKPATLNIPVTDNFNHVWSRQALSNLNEVWQVTYHGQHFNFVNFDVNRFRNFVQPSPKGASSDICAILHTARRRTRDDDDEWSAFMYITIQLIRRNFVSKLITAVPDSSTAH